MLAVQLMVGIATGLVESFCVSLLALLLMYMMNNSSSFKKDFKSKRKFLLFWGLICIVYISNHFIDMFIPDFKWIKPAIFAAFMPIYAYYIYKTKYYKNLIIAIMVLALSAILEVIIVLILKSFDIDPINIVSNIYYNSINACIISIIELSIGIVAYKFSKELATLDNKLSYFLPQLIAIIICLFPTMGLLMLNYFKYSALFITINLLQLFVVSFVGIYNLKFVAKHENTEMELANTIVYNETLKKVNDGVRGFKHDMGNIVQSILGYIAINDSEGAKKYCQNLVIGFNDINVLSILSPKVIDDPAIYGVVVNKILVARDKNMTLSLDVNLNVSEINFPKFELSRILGILIDNAIEAGEQTEEKKLIVNMHHDYNNNTDIIVISNSIENLNIDINRIFEKDYSTKENPSGFGLYEVKKFIDKNPQSYIETTIDKDKKLFTQTIIINSDIKNVQE